MLNRLNGANCELGVDYFSKYPKVIKLKTTTCSDIIDAFKPTFSRYSIPEIFISDNALQYTSTKLSEFKREYDFSISPAVLTICKLMDTLNRVFREC